MIKTCYQFARHLKLFLCIVISFAFLIGSPQRLHAKVQSDDKGEGLKIVRSLESLRDLEYQTWQLVAYKEEKQINNLTLRIVGFPGTLRLEHPVPLKVHSGRRDWKLRDTTLSNKKLASDPRDAAAEFDLMPLVADLRNDRPLRLRLDGAFNELPVPPYVVSEWRSLLNTESLS